MDMKEIRAKAKGLIGPYCKVCPHCNGVACRGMIPGPGGKASGIGFIRNYEAFRKYGLQMDTLYEVQPIDMKVRLFGLEFEAPFFAAPIGAVQLHYGMAYDDTTYNQALLKGCYEEGIAAFTGDGIEETVFTSALAFIKELGGRGIPTIKPWENKEMIRKLTQATAAGAMAIAMDIDSAGLSILADKGKPVSPKSVSDLKEVMATTSKPVILKGIMTPEGARKAYEAGAKAIVVSNHGGRVLDEVPASLDALPAIAEAVKGKLHILLDGGIRSGQDIVKALALGADGVLIGRPYVTAVYGGGLEGVRLYNQQLKKEIHDTMLMMGVTKVSDLRPHHLKAL